VLRIGSNHISSNAATVRDEPGRKYARSSAIPDCSRSGNKESISNCLVESQCIGIPHSGTNGKVYIKYSSHICASRETVQLRQRYSAIAAQQNGPKDDHGTYGGKIVGMRSQIVGVAQRKMNYMEITRTNLAVAHHCSIAHQKASMVD